MNAAQGVIGQTRLELAAAAREARSAWSWTATLWVLAFLAAALVPLVLAEGRMADLAGFVYLALAAVGLGYAVGLAGIPSLGQGAFLGIGAFTEALLRAKAEWPLLPSLLVAIAVTAVAGVLTGIATGRLRSAFVAASTWILSWIVLIALTSFPGISGGAQGLVLPETTVLGHLINLVELATHLELEQLFLDDRVVVQFLVGQLLNLPEYELETVDRRQQ